MRRLVAGDFENRVTFITGPRRASGKTALMLAVLAMLRRRGVAAGILGIGFEGESKGLGSPGARATSIAVEAGELFASASAWLSASGTGPEILGVLSGSGAFGALALVRAHRRGKMVLVGPDSNDATAEAIAMMRAEGATTILVDGAFGRLTQVASIEGARFFQSLIIERGGLGVASAYMRRLASLVALPLFEAGADRGGSTASGVPAASGRGGPQDRKDFGRGFVEIEGPLTQAVVASLPEKPSIVSIEDLTKVFVEDSVLRSLRSRHELVVRRRIDFGGFVVALRGISRDELEDSFGSSAREVPVFASPYEEEASIDAA